MRYAFAFAFYLLVLPLCAKPIEGTVYDAETKEVLPFANIMVAGQYKGTVANSEGHFLLDLEGISPQDTLLFSYMGYETFRVLVADMQDGVVIYLQPAAINLSEVKVLSKELTAEEIIKLIDKHYEKNYPLTATKQRLFFHKYEHFPFPKENKLTVQKTNFASLDQATLDGLFKKLPTEFNGYQDVVFDLYDNGEDSKFVLLQAISLEEGSQQVLFKEFEDKLGGFLEDIEKSMSNKDIYYKFRTGILGVKMEAEEEDRSVWEENKKDTAHYTVQTDIVKRELDALVRNYATLDGKNWEFIQDPHKYEYTIKNITAFNQELVYEITFAPKKRGLYEGVLYVSTDTYAILQMDFAYAKGKQTEKFNLLGLSHAMNYKRGRVIFERGKEGYFLKYIQAEQQESGSVNREFSIMKKQKRFFIDKELNEIKLKAQMTFDVKASWELLLLDREQMDGTEYAKAKEPPIIKYKKEYAYTPEAWDNMTGIAPSTELKKYKRK